MSPRFITAVALYGKKDSALKRMLETVQAVASERLRDRFHPYTMDQIHSTVIRLDGIPHGRTGFIVNEHYLDLAGIPRAMNYARALEIFSVSLAQPISIRIGGFRPNKPTTFASRGQHPYERTFSAQDGAFVLVGWPTRTIVNGFSQRPLDDLRRKMNDANILHWYHESWTDIDNDSHFVVGHYNNSLRDEIGEIERAIRIYLSRHPTEVEIGIDQVAIIASDSHTLVPGQVVGRLPMNPVELMRLYL